MKSSQKAARHKSNKSNYKLIVACLLGALIVYVLGYYAVQYVSMQRETDSFFKLKSDFQNLQVEFNKVDKGWEYGEGCVGRGGVYESQVPHSCAMSLTNRSLGRLEKLKQYMDSIERDKSNVFSVKQTPSSSDNYRTLYSKSLPNSNCSFEITADHLYDQNDPRYITLGCSHSARQFYFPRNDR